MEKGFNDDELADIMNEIESLEKEFSEETQSEPVVAEDPIAQEMAESAEEEPVAEMVEEAVEEPVAEMVEEAVEEPVAEMVEEAVEEPVAEMVEEAVEEPVAEVFQEPVAEVLAEVAEMPVEKVVAQHEIFEENVHPISAPSAVKAPATTGGHSSMSFTVEGDMKLDLNFNVSGKQVQLNISENGFELELEGGMKFSIPLDDQSSHKKSA